MNKMHKATPITFKASALKQTREGSRALLASNKSMHEKGGFQSYRIDPKNEKKEELDIDPNVDQTQTDPPPPNPPNPPGEGDKGSTASGQGGGDGKNTEEVEEILTEEEKQKNAEALKNASSVINQINLGSLHG